MLTVELYIHLAAMLQILMTAGYATAAALLLMEVLPCAPTTPMALPYAVYLPMFNGALHHHAYNNRESSQ